MDRAQAVQPSHCPGRRHPRRPLQLSPARRRGGGGQRVAVAFTTFFTLLGDWVQLRKLTVEARTFKQQIADQQATIDSFNRRVVELRQEMAGWRDLHARIWEPFGPEPQPGGRDRAIGGGALRPDSKTGRLSPRDELEQLAENVAEQGESLKALDRLVARAGKRAGRAAVTLAGTRCRQLRVRHAAVAVVCGAPSSTAVSTSARSTARPCGRPPRARSRWRARIQEYGITVILDHGQDIKSLYGHLSRMNVKPGDRVERGAVVGWSGNTRPLHRRAPALRDPGQGTGGQSRAPISGTSQNPPRSPVARRPISARIVRRSRDDCTVEHVGTFQKSSNVRRPGPGVARRRESALRSPGKSGAVRGCRPRRR